MLFNTKAAISASTRNSTGAPFTMFTTAETPEPLAAAAADCCALVRLGWGAGDPSSRGADTTGGALAAPAPPAPPAVLPLALGPRWRKEEGVSFAAESFNPEGCPAHDHTHAHKRQTHTRTRTSIANQAP